MTIPAIKNEADMTAADCIQDVHAEIERAVQRYDGDSAKAQAVLKRLRTAEELTRELEEELAIARREISVIHAVAARALQSGEVSR